jgi:hypothetical protein
MGYPQAVHRRVESPLPSFREILLFLLLGLCFLALATPVFARKMRKLQNQAKSIRNAELLQVEFQASQTPITRLNP